MDQAVHNAVRFLSIPVDDSMRMASETPAEILGLSEKGRVALGADADLVVQETIVADKTVYQRWAESHGR